LNPSEWCRHDGGTLRQDAQLLGRHHADESASPQRLMVPRMSVTEPSVATFKVAVVSPHD